MGGAGNAGGRDGCQGDGTARRGKYDPLRQSGDYKGEYRVGKNPGILISGHDLHDIEDLLKQTEGTGVDVYTHSEMLPAHYYPAFKKYKHFVGNYGNAWWKQREEFTAFNGPIVFTTNCIVPPLSNATYKERMFTGNSTDIRVASTLKRVPTDIRIIRK